MKNKNIIIASLIIIIGVVVCSNIMMYYSYTKVNRCLKEYRLNTTAKLNAYHHYKDATEALLDNIDKDVSLEDTYLCGDVGSDYYDAVLQLDSLYTLK